MTIITPEPVDNEGETERSELVESVVDVAEVAVESADRHADQAATETRTWESRCLALQDELAALKAQPAEVKIEVHEETPPAPPEPVEPAVEEPTVIEDDTPKVKQETEGQHKKKVNKRRKGMKLYGRPRK